MNKRLWRYISYGIIVYSPRDFNELGGEISRTEWKLTDNAYIKYLEIIIAKL